MIRKKKLITFIIGMSIIMIGCFTPKYSRTTKDDESKMFTEVSDWVKKFALYPESYEPISFDKISSSHSVSNDNENPKRRKYSIIHSFKLIDKNNEMCTSKCYFTLEYDYSINMIDFERNVPFGGAFPPRVDNWLDKFGRNLTKSDTLEFLENIDKDYKSMLRMTCTTKIKSIKEYYNTDSLVIYRYFFNVNGAEKVGFYYIRIDEIIEFPDTLMVNYACDYPEVNRLKIN